MLAQKFKILLQILNTLSGNVVFDTMSHRESTRARREYGRAFLHTFVISRKRTRI